MLLYESLGHNEKLHQDIDLEGQEAERNGVGRLVNLRHCASERVDFGGSAPFWPLPQTVGSVRKP